MVNIYELKFTQLQLRILRYLFIKSGISVNGRKISKDLKVSQTAVMKSLPLLEKEELILLNQDKESKRWEISINRENQKVIWLKRADNLKQIYESGFAHFLYDSFPGALIILFGSYSNGEDTKNSDIDLAVVGVKPKNVNLNEYEKILEREIIINYYSSLNTIDKELKNNILNGIILKGAVNL